MLNWIWFALVVIAIAYGGVNGSLDAVKISIFDDAKAAVNIVIGLVGVMAIWLGVMRIAFDGGLRDVVARFLAPVLRRLFPDVPPDHPAMSSMIMNMASNMLGLGNAATPFGLKAMSELAKLNPFPGAASNPMVLFLAINTSQIALIPLGTIGIRAVQGSADPFSIWVPTLIATSFSTVAGISAYFALGKLPAFAHRALDGPAPDLADSEFDLPEEEPPELSPQPAHRIAARGVALLLAGVMLFDVVRFEGSGFELVQYVLGTWLMLLLFIGLVLYGLAKGVPLYESAVEGAKDGIQVGVRIVPYLVVMLVALGMLRGSGALDALIGVLDPITRTLGVPAEVLPMAIIRPLSGSGAMGVMVETIQTYGPDSFVGQLTCTIMGSTETTFYVLAVYYGVAGIRATRHTVLACLTADFFGFVGAVVACHWWFR